jgi:endonuclease YncB( thermonuclease family)
MRTGRVLQSTVLMVLVLLLVASPALAFTDTAASPYGYAIDQLAAREIIGGYNDGTFRPGNLVWRAQFAKMIVGALGLEVLEADTLAPFTDLGPDNLSNLYPHEYVAAAYFNGITTGKTPTRYAPWDDISRAQVMTMVVRALDNLYPGILEDAPTSYAAPWGNFDSTHQGYAKKAFWNGLDTGLEHPGFQPWGKMPRGEVAQMLWNVVQLVEGIIWFEMAEVTRVIDGDTLEVLYEGRRETVRLIGIDAPESGQTFAAEAKTLLETMVLGQTVGLEFDLQERDQYGRLLAWVWYPDHEGYVLANHDLVFFGLAVVYTVPPNVAHIDALLTAQQLAQELGNGMWGD